ncbi:MAG: chromate transporter [Sphaerochaeta sp.]|jgi:chromate transporter|nr:chromate transporter [Sphaerochaeta sp.]
MRVRLAALYLAFLKIGALTFGGGYAMLPMLQREVIDKHGWATAEEVLDIWAIGQCTPGIIAVNTATMIGYRKRGIAGAIVATLGEVTPSLLIITALASLLARVQDSVWVARAFAGIRIAVCALIVQSIITLARKSVVDLPSILLFLASVVLTFLFGFTPIAVVTLAIFCGLIVGWVRRGRS